jgi:Zinc knuckle
MADRGYDDRAVRPLPVFNSTMTSPSKKGDDGDSYAVWRARLVINLRGKRLLSIVTGNDVDEDSDDDELQPSVQRHQARAAHIMTSVPEPVRSCSFKASTTILRPYSAYSTQSTKALTRRLSCQPSTSSPPRYRPDQHMEMFVAEFEGLAMRLEDIGHGVSEQMRVVNFLNSLSEVSALSAVLSALRVIDNISWAKATTQILLESELKGVNNNGSERPERAMVSNNGFNGTCYTCGEVGHRISDHFARGPHQSRHPMRRYGGHGGGHHAASRQGDCHVDHHQGHGGARPGGARQGGARHEEDIHGSCRQGGDQYRVRFSNDGNNIWRHASAAPAIGYHHRDKFNHANYSSDDDQFDSAASAIVTAHHVG